MDESSLDPDPLRQFQRWFREARGRGRAGPGGDRARNRDGRRPPVRADGAAEARPDERGFDFHTNFESRKGGELAANPHAALLFHWQLQGRQVRIEGTVERVAAEESEEYFRTRPPASRLAAWASPQSRPLADRAELERLFADVEDRFRGQEVPLPPHWGGFRLVPEAYEFWQHGDDRLHDRVRYERDGDGWQRVRLAP